MGDDFYIDMYWQKITEDTDVLISHSPRHGTGDKVYMTQDSKGTHVGSQTLGYRMKELKNLKAHFLGTYMKATG